MITSNNIHERKNIDGSLDYVVSLGSILYNDTIRTVGNLVIPFKSDTLFSLPEDINKYASVNVYYDMEYGAFTFDVIKKSDKPVGPISASAINNLIPIGQFVIHQILGGYEVIDVYGYSQMATFALSKELEKGDKGAQGPIGYTGLVGLTGAIGFTGYQGETGSIGVQGETGLGYQGITGIQGETGSCPDIDLAFYAKFKSEGDILQDYSVYERDFVFTATGAGFTGYIDPSWVYVPRDATQFEVQEGIADNCHALSYMGGYSAYTRGNTGLEGITGVIQAWVRVDMPPIPDFSYTASMTNPLRLTFQDESLFNPTQWYWDFVGVSTSTSSSIQTTFPSHGDYVVTLKVTNEAGTTEKSKMVVV